jgi:hypothetical protein
MHHSIQNIGDLPLIKKVKITSRELAYLVAIIMPK